MTHSYGCPRVLILLFFCALAIPTGRASAETESADPAQAESGGGGADLAKKLANPVASLVSVPLQSNWDFGAGPGDDGLRYTLNVQPVIPITLNEKWNVISRTIVPVIYQDDVIPNEGNQFGLGDTLQRLFFSPKSPGPVGLIWGAGPALFLPTGCADFLRSGKWAAGPTVVALVQRGPWTVGGLANHLWSYASTKYHDDFPDIDATFMQPFVNYTTHNATSFLVNTETTYDWEGEEWTVPINFGVLQMFKLGKLPIQVGLQGRVYADRPDGGPNWGLRIPVVFLFPV